MPIMIVIFGYFSAGLLLGLSAYAHTGWVLAVVGLGLLAWSIKNSISWKMVMGGGVLTATLKALVVVSIFWSVYPLDWLPVSSGVALVLVLSYAIYSGLGPLIGTVVSIVVWRWVLQTQASWGIVLLPSAWLGGEVLGAFLYSKFMLSEFVTSTLAPSVFSIGHAAVKHSGLFYFAKWGGVFILTFLLVLVVAGFFITYSNGRDHRRYAWYLSGVVFVATSFLTLKTNTSLPVIAVVETDFRVDFMEPDQALVQKTKEETLFRAVKSALGFSPEVIILPEDARFISYGIDSNQALGFYQLALSGPTSLLIDSARVEARNGAYLRARAYDPIDRRVWQADKQKLIPLGEYLPSALAILLSVIKADQERETALSRLNYRPGPLFSQADFPAHVPGLLFCLESLSPLAAYRLAKERELSFIAHPVSHAWFNDASILEKVLRAPLLTQARFAGVPIVSAANAGTSHIYWPSGRVETPLVVAEGEGWRVRLIGTDRR